MHSPSLNSSRPRYLNQAAAAQSATRATQIEALKSKIDSAKSKIAADKLALETTQQEEQTRLAAIDRRAELDRRVHESGTQARRRGVNSKSSTLDELKEVAERGKKKAPDTDELKLTDVHVDVLETSSLTHPYVGRIISTWERKGRGDRFWIYYKYENGKWIPTWNDRGGVGTISPLTEYEVMRTPGDPRFIFPWESTNPQLIIWIP